MEPHTWEIGEGGKSRKVCKLRGKFQLFYWSMEPHTWEIGGKSRKVCKNKGKVSTFLSKYGTTHFGNRGQNPEKFAKIRGKFQLFYQSMEYVGNRGGKFRKVLSKYGTTHLGNFKLWKML